MCDKESAKVYRDLGYTHIVAVRSPDPRQPDGYKPVRKHATRDVYVDENGVEYDEAEDLPEVEQPKKKSGKSD